MSHSTTGKHFWSSIATWLIFSLAFAIKPTFAQVFPVQANINVTPPYTVYLSHYTAPDQQRVMASVLLHDPVVTSLDVRFRFTIEGAGIRIYTNPGWIPAPFTLRSGITELIPADIIAEYFRPQNVIAEGINPQELFRKGKLPEGFYQFKIEVLEYQRGVPISNVGRTGVWLLLSEPPRVVFPTPNQKVNATNPQILNFTWVPGGVTSPLSALNTMYEFTLVELMGEVNPTVAITTASDAIKFTRTQQQTTLLYGPGDPQLIPGKRYAYRVRAYNTDGYELFKNNGYSEVRVFQFGDACNAPTMFSLKDETQSTFSIDVVSDPSSTAWQAQFRESGDEAGQWSELKAEPGTSTKTVKGLKASTTYQVQLKSLCGTVSSSYTTPQTITTKEKVNTQRSCENSVSPFVVSQAQPLQQLKPNDIFLAALMPIKVTEVTSQGGGKFSGKGIATVPLFSAGLAVHFTDIGINELMQLTAGEVVVERNAVNVTLLGDTDPTGNGSTTGNGTATDTTGNDGWPEFTDTINISSDIDSVVVVNDTTVWVYTSGGGEPVIVDMGGSDCLLIVPADGNMDNAQVVYNGAAKPYSAGSGSTSDTDEQYTGFRARFAPAPNTQYGFDSLRVQAYANQYNDLEIDGKTYKLPWKALPVNIPDPVTLHILRSADSYPYSDLKVGVLGGNDLLPTAGANTATQTYNLTGTNDGDQYAVVAKYTQEGKSKYVGGLWAATYQKKEHKLYIVPLPGVEVPAATIGLLQNGLNQIYSQAVVRWTVKPLNGLTGVELGDNGLDWADSEMLSSYNAEMNSVISEFKNWKTDADPDAYYLFVVPQFSEGGLEGFMPRNRRFGFVTLSQLDARLVAHEIGHGAFNLRHTFPEVAQGSTDNLMDYAEGNSLLKPQWDLIHNPETTTGLFDDMEDGAYSSGLLIADAGRILNTIRNANKENKEELAIQLTTGSFKEDQNFEIGNKILSYLSMTVTGFNVFSDKQPSATINSNAGTTTINLDRPSYNMKPSEISKTVFTEKNAKFVKYIFHELQNQQNVTPYADTKAPTGKVRIEIIVKDDEQLTFENYILGRDMPLSGNPLINMSIVHTNTAPTSGGMFGCSRTGGGCDLSTISNLPKYSDKEKVHDGIDFYAQINTDVFAMYSGKVILLKDDVIANQEDGDNLLGNYIYIKSESTDHNKSSSVIIICYAHLNKVVVKNGQDVKQGEKIGESGKTGNAFDIPDWRSHLHLTIYENNTLKSSKVDPRNYITTKFDANGNKTE